MAKKLLIIGFCLASSASFAREGLNESVNLEPYRVFAVKALDETERLPAGQMPQQADAQAPVVDESSAADHAVPEYWHRGQADDN